MFNYNELLFNEKDSDFKILVSLHNLYCSYNYLSNTAYTRLYSIPFYHTDGWIFLTHSFNEAFFSKATDFFWLEFLFPTQISSPNHFFFARLYFWFWVLLLRSKRAATQNTQNVGNISILIRHCTCWRCVVSFNRTDANHETRILYLVIWKAHLSKQNYLQHSHSYRIE